MNLSVEIVEDVLVIPGEPDSIAAGIWIQVWRPCVPGMLQLVWEKIPEENLQPLQNGFRD